MAKRYMRINDDHYKILCDQLVKLYEREGIERLFTPSREPDAYIGKELWIKGIDGGAEFGMNAISIELFDDTYCFAFIANLNGSDLQKLRDAIDTILITKPEQEL